MLESFGVKLTKEGQAISIEGGQVPQARDFRVPGDISSAAFWVVAAAAIPGAKLIIKDVGLNSTRTAILDVIERMGVERSRKAMETAQIIIQMSDGLSRPQSGMNDANDVHGTIIKVRNKADLLENEKMSGLEDEGLLISAKNGEIEPLKQELVRIAKETMQTSSVMLSNARHYEAISRAHEAILRVQQGLAEGLSGELLSMDLQDCLAALGEVTGQITNAEVLNTIFSKFCIGK
jgi:tRNA U34 5-carboxymethylaminomethyl modifying GTPase MnmE/TrmE